MRRTKLIATIGPSSNRSITIRKMLLKGVDVFRLNFSHGTLAEKKKIIGNIRKIAGSLRKYIPIVADLQGPVIRVKCSGPIDIKKGGRYVLSYNKGDMRVGSSSFFKNVDKNDILLVDDGKLIFEVIGTSTNSIEVISHIDGVLYSDKKILIKNKEFREKSLTEKDVKDLNFAIKNKLEYIALSMVKSGENISELKEYLLEKDCEAWILAKIETPSGVKNIREIVEECDGVIVARGDLGQYYPLEKIPILQKKIVYEGNRLGKITVVATQILESMRDNETPTRAEITDIFNSVEENVDAIMLTGETAIGRYPVEVVGWARSILEEADREYSSEMIYYKDDLKENTYDKFARGAIYISHILNGKIVGFTKKGNTARRLSRYRPKKDIFIATYDPAIARKINLLYGINPIVTEKSRDYWETIRELTDKLKREKLLYEGEIIIFTVGLRKESTDMLKIEVI